MAGTKPVLHRPRSDRLFFQFDKDLPLDAEGRRLQREFEEWRDSPSFLPFLGGTDFPWSRFTRSAARRDGSTERLAVRRITMFARQSDIDSLPDGQLLVLGWVTNVSTILAFCDVALGLAFPKDASSRRTMGAMVCSRSALEMTALLVDRLASDDLVDLALGAGPRGGYQRLIIGTLGASAGELYGLLCDRTHAPSTADGARGWDPKKGPEDDALAVQRCLGLVRAALDSASELAARRSGCEWILLEPAGTGHSVIADHTPSRDMSVVAQVEARPITPWGPAVTDTSQHKHSIHDYFTRRDSNLPSLLTALHHLRHTYERGSFTAAMSPADAMHAERALEICHGLVESICLAINWDRYIVSGALVRFLLFDHLAALWTAVSLLDPEPTSDSLIGRASRPPDVIVGADENWLVRSLDSTGNLQGKGISRGVLDGMFRCLSTLTHPSWLVRLDPILQSNFGDHEGMTPLPMHLFPSAYSFMPPPFEDRAGSDSLIRRLGVTALSELPDLGGYLPTEMPLAGLETAAAVLASPRFLRMVSAFRRPVR